MEAAAPSAIVAATCASCGAVKFEKDPCPMCGGRKNEPGSTRTLGR